MKELYNKIIDTLVNSNFEIESVEKKNGTIEVTKFKSGLWIHIYCENLIQIFITQINDLPYIDFSGHSVKITGSSIFIE